MRKISVAKSRVLCQDDPLYKFYPLRNNVASINKIEHIEDVKTTDGIMSLVVLKTNFDINDPDNNLAMYIGDITQYARLSKRIQIMNAAVWFWKDKFWCKAVNFHDSTTYYKKDKYIFFEIDFDKTKLGKTKFVVR